MANYSYSYSNCSTVSVLCGPSISSSNYDVGQFNMGRDCKIEHNTGKITIGPNSTIKYIGFNDGTIHIGSKSRVRLVEHNCGKIIMEEGCTVERI